MTATEAGPGRTLTHETHGRYTPEEVTALLRAVSDVAHPYGRAAATARGVVLHEAGPQHGWPSYRACALAPTGLTPVYDGRLPWAAKLDDWLAPRPTPKAGWSC